MMTKQMTNLDSLSNVISGLGTAKSKRSYNQWNASILNDYATLEGAYTGNWIAGKIVDIPAEDMTREWRRIKSDGAEDIAAEEQRLNVQCYVQEAIQWGRLYGGAGILMVTGQDLTKPLNVNRIRKGDLQKLLVFDRFDMTAQQLNTWDILASNYLRPEFYSIRGSAMQIHHSHIARFIGRNLPLRLQQQTQGWGDSVLRKCIEDVTDMVAAKNGIAELMQEANIDIITRTGLTDELATDQDDIITKRYELFSMMKSSIQMALLDGDEKFDRMTLNLSGVAPIIEQFMTWISGACSIPITRMFGTSAKGMNATGEGDEGVYFDGIRSMQTNYLTPPMRQLDEVMVRSALGSWPTSFDYVWNPLVTPNNVEQAQAEHLQAQKDIMYLEASIVQRSQIQRNLQSAEVYQFDDDKIDELEELESANMFEELPPVGGDVETDVEFADNYTRLLDSGLDHDSIMTELKK